MDKSKIIDILNESRKDFSAKHRLASFDLCYGYFQTHHQCLVEHMMLSCLHLWAYLASWGMLRGRGKLLKRSSMKAMECIVSDLSKLNDSDWSLDLGLDENGKVDDEKSHRIIELYERICNTIEKEVGVTATPTLITKIMLGTLGCVPALDRNFKDALCKSADICCRVGSFDDVLKCVQWFYLKYHHVIDDIDFKVIDFDSKPTNMYYPRARVLDMIGFEIGKKI